LDSTLSRRRRALWAAALGLVTGLGCLAVPAAEPDIEEGQALPLKYSVMPFGGYRFGGRFAIGDTNTHVDTRNHLAYGAAFDVATDESTQYELFYSRQSTTLHGSSLAPSDITVQYLHIGGSIPLADSPRFEPYLVATIGATRLSPDSPTGIDRTYFSASLGTGVKIPFSTHLALHLEARGFATFFGSNTSILCRSDQSGGLCQIQGRGSAFFQGDALAGLAYTF